MIAEDGGVRDLALDQDSGDLEQRLQGISAAFVGR
jgi:hypothetical protein